MTDNPDAAPKPNLEWEGIPAGDELDALIAKRRGANIYPKYSTNLNAAQILPTSQDLAFMLEYYPTTGMFRASIGIYVGHVFEAEHMAFGTEAAVTLCRCYLMWDDAQHA